MGVKVYPTIQEIPSEVDLAVLTVPRAALLDVIRECSRKGTKAVIIYASGFAETGPEGIRLQEEIVRAAQEGGTRVVGPSSLGSYNASARFASQHILPRESGPVGVISHSGYLFYYLLLSVASRRLGTSKGISCGNDADLTCVDFLEYMGQDPDTKIIVAYLEGIGDGRRLFDVARETSRTKPIIVLKGGKTDEGNRVSASHTGTLAVPAAVWRALCRQTGIISVESFALMMDTMVALCHLPRSQGKRVGIISVPGGLAVACTDACIEMGLEVPRLSPETRKRLAGVVESVGTSINNPVDLGPSAPYRPDYYVKESFAIVAGDPNVDMILMALPGMALKLDESRDRVVADLLIKQIAAASKPTVICSSKVQGWDGGEMKYLAESNLPVFPDVKRTVRVLAKLAEYGEFLKSA